MGCPAEVVIGDNLTFSVTTHDPDTGILTDSDAVPAYRLYEDETAVPILSGDMAKLDDANTTGFYTETVACTAINGFENGKTYTIYITASVGGEEGGIPYAFKATDLYTKIGTPVALDGAAATIGAMLTKMADDNGGADFNATDHSQKAIRDAITAASPLNYHPDASSIITTGNEDSGTWADTASNNATYWDIGDTGTGILVVCEFNMGANRTATDLVINGYFSSGASRKVEIYAWNYISGAYEKLSAGTSTTEMRNRVSDIDYIFALTLNHTDPITVPGEVKIKFEAAQSNNGDTLKLDEVTITGVSSGSTSLEAIADAVWQHDILGTIVEGSSGYFLRTSRALITDIAVEDTTTSFTLIAGVAVADAYNGMIIMVEDETDEHYEVRRIVDYTAGRVVTVDRAFGFTPTVGDDVYVMATGYADVNTTHVAGTAQTGIDIGNTVTEVRLAELDAANIPADLDNAMGATFATATDSLEAIRNRGDAAWITGAGGDATLANQEAIMGATFVEADDSLEAIRDRGDAAWVTGAAGGDATLANQTAMLANQTTILSRIGAFTGTGVNTILGFFRAIMSKIASTPSDVGGTFSAADDSLETISEIVTVTGPGDGSVSVDTYYDNGVDAAYDLSYKTGGGIGVDNCYVRAFLTSDYDAGARTNSEIKGVTKTDVNGEFVAPLRLDVESYTLEFSKQGLFGPDTVEIVVR